MNWLLGGGQCRGVCLAEYVTTARKQGEYCVVTYCWVEMGAHLPTTPAVMLLHLGPSV